MVKFPITVALILSVMLPLTAYAQFNNSSNTLQNYNLREGDWVKYGPVKLDVKSDSNYLKLIAKGALSKSLIPFSDSNNQFSLADIDWILVNISSIRGDEVNSSVTVKSVFSEMPITNYYVNYINGSEPNIYSLYLPKNARVGDRLSYSNGGENFPLYINRTLQKTIGSHVVDGYEVVGTQNSFDQSTGSANERNVNIFYNKDDGRPLGLELSGEVGVIIGTVSFSAKINALDWSQ